MYAVPLLLGSEPWWSALMMICEPVYPVVCMCVCACMGESVSETGGDNPGIDVQVHHHARQAFLLLFCLHGAFLSRV
jgi:hypothetical protein